MAQKTIIQLTDDIDGTEADETVTFTLDGVSYEIDLNDKNAGKLRKALEPYAEAGRKLRGSSSRSNRSTPAKSSGSDTAAVREWALANNIEISSRGRISADVRQAYDDAH